MQQVSCKLSMLSWFLFHFLSCVSVMENILQYLFQNSLQKLNLYLVSLAFMIEIFYETQ